MIPENSNKIAFFENIYYWMSYYYIKSTKITKYEFDPINIVTVLIPICKCLNIMFVYQFVSILIANPAILLQEEDKYKSILFIYTILIFADHYYFSKREKIMIKQYEEYSPEKQQKGKVIFWFYIVLTILTSFMLIWL